jgi:hypothetical protein
LPVLVEYIHSIFREIDNNNWWEKFIIPELPEYITRDLPKNRSSEEFINKIDISACLKIIIKNWHNIFKHKMTNIKLSWIHELLEIRNEEAHPTIEKLTSYSDDDIYHTLDTMELCMRKINEGLANQIFEIKKSFENEYINNS